MSLIFLFYQVKSSPELGRYLEASRPLSHGSTILSESPVVAGPRDEKVCLGCYKADPKSQCPQCGWPACEASCPGLQDLAHHGAECVLLRTYSRRVQYVSEDFFKYVQYHNKGYIHVYLHEYIL